MEEMASAVQQLRELAQQQQAQIAALTQQQAAAQPPTLVVQNEDLKLGKPGNFKGEKQAFDDWDVKFRAWLGSQD